MIINLDKEVIVANFGDKLGMFGSKNSFNPFS